MSFQRALVAFLLLIASGTLARADDILLFETFGIEAPPAACSPAFPGGWVRHNVDGRTPASMVSYVTDAWIARDDFAFSLEDCAAFSTSWYQPVGQADDWMVTPAIQMLAHGMLSWRAVAYDPLFPDGYEVRVSTTGSDVADFASGLLLTVPAENSTWTQRSLNLDAYAGQTVHFAWRNNSNDRFLLLVDDISVTGSAEHNAAVTAVAYPIPGYTSVPASQGFPVRRTGTIMNQGVGLLTNVGADVSVVVNGGALSSSPTTPVASLAPGASSEQSLPDFLPGSLPQGLLRVRFTATSAEIDEDPDDDEELSASIVLAAEELARDNGAMIGPLGVAAEGGELGSVFEIERPAIVRGVRFYTAASNPLLVGLSITANLREMTSEPTSGDPIATSVAYVVPDPPVAGWYDLLFDPPRQLAAGQYYAGLNEPAGASLDLGSTSSIFTAGANWVFWNLIPGGNWLNPEVFGVGFQRALMLRLLVTPGIFIDDFESGAGCAWSSSQPDVCA